MRSIHHMTKLCKTLLKKATDKSKKHGKVVSQACQSSHDITGELHQFNQIMEDQVSLSEDEDAPTNELNVTLDVPDFQPPVTQYSQVNE